MHIATKKVIEGQIVQLTERIKYAATRVQAAEEELKLARKEYDNLKEFQKELSQDLEAAGA